ncbi:MAG: sigma-70 family RNA polymerase sigma factor [Verrucomicrobiota bacterium]
MPAPFRISASAPPAANDDDRDAADLREFRDSGSDAAFTALVRRHLPLVFHAARRRLGAAALAEEAAQNAFARLALKAAAVARHPERLRAWLHRTAFLEACALARKEARLSRLPAPEEAPVFTPMNRPELYERLDEALSALPELDRELLLRRYCEGEDFRRIAAAVGKSETACQKRVERAVLRLNRTLLGQRSRVPNLRDARAPVSSWTAATATALAGMGRSAGSGGSAGSDAQASVLPSVSRVAAAALRKRAAADAAGAGFGLAAAGSGTLAAAVCVVAALAGVVAGWSQASNPAVARALSSDAMNSGLPAATPGAVSASATGLAPPPDRRARPLEEVLESIQAGRLGPLIDFLPTATPADLRSVLAEDDRVHLSEGSPPPGEARKMALRHWTDIDPAGAFAWAFQRDGLASGLILPDSAVVLAAWMRSDPAAASAAFAAVPLPDRSPLASGLVEEDDEMAGRLPESHPEIFAAVTAARSHRREKPAGSARPGPEQERLTAAVVAGTADPALPEAEILDAFCRTAFQDSDLRLDQVNGIPDPALKTRVMAELIARYAPQLPAARLEEINTGLPPSMTRTRLAALIGGKVAAENPETAFQWLETAPPGLERDVYYRQAADALAVADPWRLLELIARMKGPVSSSEGVLLGITGSANGLPSAGWFPGLANGGALDRLLIFAGEDDPARALKLLAGIAENQPGHWSRKPVSNLIKQVLTGWVERDAPAAARWADASGSDEIRKLLPTLPQSRRNP